MNVIYELVLWFMEYSLLYQTMACSKRIHPYTIPYLIINWTDTILLKESFTKYRVDNTQNSERLIGLVIYFYFEEKKNCLKQWTSLDTYYENEVGCKVEKNPLPPI